MNIKYCKCSQRLSRFLFKATLIIKLYYVRPTSMVTVFNRHYVLFLCTYFLKIFLYKHLTIQTCQIIFIFSCWREGGIPINHSRRLCTRIGLRMVYLGQMCKSLQTIKVRKTVPLCFLIKTSDDPYSQDLIQT